MKAREGDLIETDDKVIFDVKGLVHPPHKVIAFPRYIPFAEGTRERGKNLYGKIYNIAERFQYLQQKAPELMVFDPVFGESLCEVPVSELAKHYKPVETLRKLRKTKNLTKLERKAVLLAKAIKEKAGIPWSNMGISGSIMAGLSTMRSDIDPIVYGVENCRKAYAALENLVKKETSLFKQYTRLELQKLFEFRSKDTIMSFEDFAKVEGRKAFQGMFMDVEYFVRFVKDWSEIGEKYGDVCYKNCGYARISATVTGDSEALFTPCTYQVESVKVLDGSSLGPITEVVSFRGRFCEQARTGEAIEAQGKVEHVSDKRSDREYYRLILGNKPQDYMSLSHG